jgi:predicted nucleic acid-binding protein
MNRLSVVFDASALIALDEIHLLERLAPLFDRCVIPPAVAAEIAPSVECPSWIEVRPLTGSVPAQVIQASLGWGESEVIALALALPGYDLVLDDRRARRRAVELGLSVVGTLGILVRAKDAGILSEIRPSIEALLATDFFVSARIIDSVLREVDER